MKWWAQLTKANDPEDCFAALAVTAAVWIALALFKSYGGRVLAHFARRTVARWDDLLADAVRATSLLLLLPVALYAGASMLERPARLDRFIGLATVVALLLQAGLWVHTSSDAGRRRSSNSPAGMSRKAQRRSDRSPLRRGPCSDTGAVARA